MENKLNVEQAENEAAAWILKREDATWSAEDEAGLQSWLKTSTNHRVAYARLRSAWREANRLEVVDVARARGEVPAPDAIWQSPFFAKKKRPSAPEEAAAEPCRVDSRRRSRFVPLQWAAGILLAVGAIASLQFAPGKAPSYRTPVGGLAVVPMDDGSKITINTDSEIRLRMTDGERRVDLIRGEAFFEVAKDSRRPFVVFAEDQRVIAVGTKFSVRLKQEAVQVAVTEGLVRMENRAAAPAAGEKSSAPLLAAGTIASANAGTAQVSIEQQPLERLEQTLSWRSGYVVLQKARLGDAVAEFNRYNRRQLILGDPGLADIVVGGNFRSDNLDGFVRLLQDGFEIRAQGRDKDIVLTRR